MHTETNESGLTDVVLRPHSYALTILMALNRLGKHVYGGTVTDAEIMRRRKANRRAKAQRKINRG